MSTNYDDLTPTQREGMSRDYWYALTEDERKALVSELCIEPNCTKPRWKAAGSFYCEEHAGKHSAAVYEKQKLEEGS